MRMSISNVFEKSWRELFHNLVMVCGAVALVAVACGESAVREGLTLFARIANFSGLPF